MFAAPGQKPGVEVPVQSLVARHSPAGPDLPTLQTFLALGGGDAGGGGDEALGVQHYMSRGRASLVFNV